MAVLDVRRFDTPDDTLSFEKTRLELVQVGGLSVWRGTVDAGWRYTEHVEPNLCQAPHAIYVVSGRLGVVMDDGTERKTGPGEVVVIEPGHDAWTVGDEACVFIDFGQSLPPDAVGG